MTKARVPTTPFQPVVYDMMLLANALMRLPALAKIKPKDANFCERQTYLVTAFITTRTLGEFAGKPKPKSKRGSELLRIDDADFGGTASLALYDSVWDDMSDTVAHLKKTRWTKPNPLPNVREVLASGKAVLDYIKPTMDGIKGKLGGDAKIWYAKFEELYAQL
jgi:hypothetical protein